jgi:YD repeat-containing protein
MPILCQRVRPNTAAPLTISSNIARRRARREVAMACFDLTHDGDVGRRANARNGHTRVLVLVAASLLPVLICASSAVAQQPASPPGPASADQRVLEHPLARVVTGALAGADVIDGGRALSGGRERSCWSEIGSSAAKTAVADGIVATILRRAGVPAELVGTSPQWLDPGIPALELSATDMVVPAGAVSLPVQRVFGGNARGLLGARWRLNWENRITRTAGGYLVSEGGREIQFAGSGGEFLGPPGERITIDDGTGVPVRIRGDLTRDVYDRQGRLARRDWGNGNSATLQYDAGGRLARIQGPHGTSLAFTFDGGRVTRIESSTGEAVNYRYSGDELVAVETPSEPPVRYAYQDGRLTRIEHPAYGPTNLAYDARGRITQRWAADGAIETWRYDDAANAVRHIDAWGAETSWVTAPDRRRVTRNEPDGRRILIEYDAVGRPLAVTNADGRAVRLGYDSAGRLTAIQGERGQATQLGYLGNTALLDIVGCARRRPPDHRVQRGRRCTGGRNRGTSDRAARLYRGRASHEPHGARSAGAAVRIRRSRQTHRKHRRTRPAHHLRIRPARAAGAHHRRDRRERGLFL